jgi:hypothetical protein
MTSKLQRAQVTVVCFVTPADGTVKFFKSDDNTLFSSKHTNESLQTKKIFATNEIAHCFRQGQIIKIAVFHRRPPFESSGCDVYCLEAQRTRASLLAACSRLAKATSDAGRYRLTCIGSVHTKPQTCMSQRGSQLKPQ